MFSRGSLSSISFATVTPSLVMRGEPNFLSRTTLRPFGPSVTRTASARRLTPRSMAWRESSPYVICFDIGSPSPHDREDFVLANDQHFLALDLDLVPGVLAEQDPIPHLHVEG